VANSSQVFGFTSGSPVVTSNGPHISTAVVWAVYSSGITGSNGALEAFAANPGGTCTAASPCTLAPIWSAPIGTASQFTTVATSGGMVYVGTRDGAVYGFGDTAAAALTPAAPATLPATHVGSASPSRDVSVTAQSAVTVTGVAASSTVASGGTNQFRVGQVTETAPGGTATPVSFPVTLHRGDRLTAPVTFHPTVPGGVSGSVAFTSSSGTSPVRVPVTGDGTTGGLYLTPSPTQFALITDTGAFASNVPVGVIVPREIDLVNGSTKAVTVTAVRPPPRPYTATGLPAVGTVLRPGQSAVIQVVFAPARPGNYPGTLAVTGSSGGTATADLTGAGLPARGLFRATPARLGFGSVPVGRTARSTITLANTGNEPATVDRAATLNAPFTDRPNVTPGLPINAGYHVVVPVTFTPRRAGRFTASYTFTWTDVTGTHTITVHISGTATSG
jgi:HYDIN/CFA65/VesB-like, Ig-like domain/PQQ-like domain